VELRRNVLWQPPIGSSGHTWLDLNAETFEFIFGYGRMSNVSLFPSNNLSDAKFARTPLCRSQAITLSLSRTAL
jgi:hypothetical protein